MNLFIIISFINKYLNNQNNLKLNFICDYDILN